MVSYLYGMHLNASWYICQKESQVDSGFDWSPC